MNMSCHSSKRSNGIKAIFTNQKSWRWISEILALIPAWYVLHDAPWKEFWILVSGLEVPAVTVIILIKLLMSS